MTGVFCLEYKGYQRGTRVKETSRIRKACMCLFDGRKDPVDIYRMHYLRNLFCMHKTKTPSIYAVTGGKITRLFMFYSLCSSSFKSFFTSALKFFAHVFIMSFLNFIKSLYFISALWC